MDFSAEEHFVKTFIKKNRRERLLSELKDQKKRYRGISRFCHTSEELLDPGKIIMSGKDMEHLPGFADFVSSHEEDCLLLSPYPFLDGEVLPLSEAAEQAVMCPDAVLILGSTFALVYGEPVKGGRDRYLLSEEERYYRDTRRQ